MRRRIAPSSPAATNRVLDPRARLIVLPGVACYIRTPPGKCRKTGVTQISILRDPGMNFLDIIAVVP